MEETTKFKGAIEEVSWNFAWKCHRRVAIVQIASNQAAILHLDNLVSFPHNS